MARSRKDRLPIRRDALAQDSPTAAPARDARIRPGYGPDTCVAGRRRSEVTVQLVDCIRDLMGRRRINP
jgi:hypothetical protein